MYGRWCEEEVEASNFLEDKLSLFDVGAEESKREDDGEWKVHKDMGPPKFDIAPSIEKAIIWCFPRVMVPMRPN